MRKAIPLLAALVIGFLVANSLAGMGWLWNSVETIPVKEEAAPAPVLATAPAPFYPALPPVDTSSFLLGGVQMNEGDQSNWINSLRHSGMNTVEVTVYAQQGRWLDNNLWFGDVSDGTLDEIRTAKAAGMQVVLVLRLQLDHAFPENRFLWHGMVYPETSYLLNRWFEGYSRFVRSWARVAEHEGVDVLAIGSEMNALFASQFVSEVPDLESYFLSRARQQRYQEKMLRLGKDRLQSRHLTVYGAPNYTDLQAYLTDQSAAKSKWAQKVACADSSNQVLAINRRRATHNYYWEKLIGELRTIYSGKLTVAANFDNFDQIKFWSKLDFVGINAYFPLRKPMGDDRPLPEQFRESWNRILRQILHFQDTMGIGHLPVLFTELGYTQSTGATLAPWQGEGFTLFETPGRDSLVIWEEQPLRREERNLAVQALAEAVRENNFPLAGVLYWKFTSWEHQVKEDPFALWIGPESDDSLAHFLGKLKTAH